MLRLLAIGDIHGHRIALERLLDVAQVESGDLLITLGDHINRGPDSKGVIDVLAELSRSVSHLPLLGNHEVLARDGVSCSESRNKWLRCGGIETLSSYGVESFWNLPVSYWKFIQSCQRAYESERYIFAHASLDPWLSVEQQSETSLFWSNLDRAATPHNSGKTLICGHTPQISGYPLDLGHTVCIDTVGTTGWLTCFDLEAGIFWQANDCRANRRIFR